ncbi:MAG: ATP-binding protein [Bdellovibrionota bacterium]
MNRAAKSGIQLDFEESFSKVYLDASALIEIFSNLIKNSFEVLERQSIESPKLTIQTEVTEGMVHVHYRDNGPGISKTHRPYIFQPFFSTKGSISAVFETAEMSEQQEAPINPKNSGLGLFLSRALAQEMGGDLRLVDTESGEGVHFVFSLPLVK